MFARDIRMLKLNFEKCSEIKKKKKHFFSFSSVSTMYNTRQVSASFNTFSACTTQKND